MVNPAPLYTCRSERRSKPVGKRSERRGRHLHNPAAPIAELMVADPAGLKLPPIQPPPFTLPELPFPPLPPLPPPPEDLPQPFKDFLKGLGDPAAKVQELLQDGLQKGVEHAAGSAQRAVGGTVQDVLRRLVQPPG